MATIALYQGKINQMPGLVNAAKQSVESLKTELSELNKKAARVDSGVCDLSDIISSVETCTRIEEDRIEALEDFQASMEEFVNDAVRIDSKAADAVNGNKENFYEEYDYLRPDSEKSGWEIFWEDVGSWCKEHWKEIVTTVVIVAGAALAIAAVVCTGGVALAPMLAAGLTALGMASGTALTVATVTSLVVAGIAVASTLASSTLNLIDLWGDMSGNSTFQTWRTAMNWTSMISNGFYSVGSIFNSAHGITNQGLREYSKAFFNKNQFASQLPTTPDSSAFWSGLGKNGAETARSVADDAGLSTLEHTMERNGVNLPTWDKANPASITAWKDASAAYAWNSSGRVTAILGDTVRSGSVWRTIEYPLLTINPNVSIIVNTSGTVLQYTSLPSLWQGLFSLIGAGTSGMGEAGVYRER